MNSAAFVRYYSRLWPRIPIHLAITDVLVVASPVYMEQVHVLSSSSYGPWDHLDNIGQRECVSLVCYAAIPINHISTEVNPYSWPFIAIAL